MHIGMPPTKRDERLHILLDRDEKRMLDELAEKLGLTVSDVVRQLVRRKHQQLAGTSKRKK